MAARKRGQRLEDELVAVDALSEAPASEAMKGLERALRERPAAVAARAARIARERGFTDLTKALIVAFERFQEDAVARDPGCLAKEAALEALDQLDANVPELFASATRWVQMEPQWGPPVDTGVNVRARAILTLARWGDHETPFLAARLLVDEQWPVRQAAADAIGVYGERAVAAMLLVALAHEAEPEVVTSCMQSLLRVTPELALAELRGAVAKSGHLRECALVALGQSGREDALALILDSLDREIIESRRDEAIRVLGLHRSERALAALLDMIESGPLGTAKSATRALAARRFDPGVLARAKTAARKNGARAVATLLAEVFQDV